MKKLLWLDDYRNPMEDEWLNFSPIGKDVEVHWVLNYKDFVMWICKNGLPDGICFDHDLGKDIELKARSTGMSKRQSRRLKKGLYTGYDCAKWLVDYCQSRKLNIPVYNIQSANPVGKENIRALLENYKKFHGYE